MDLNEQYEEMLRESFAELVEDALIPFYQCFYTSEAQAELAKESVMKRLRKLIEEGDIGSPADLHTAMQEEARAVLERMPYDRSEKERDRLLEEFREEYGSLG